MTKLHSFLLVDDNKSTNVFNSKIISKTNCVEEIRVAENGKEALDIIASGVMPEIIFLDINMPVMNGWEFLVEYQKLEETYKKSIIILVTGTKLLPSEEEKLNAIVEIKEYSGKMLTTQFINEIIHKYFGHSLEPEIH